MRTSAKLFVLCASLWLYRFRLVVDAVGEIVVTKRHNSCLSFCASCGLRNYWRFQATPMNSLAPSKRNLWTLIRKFPEAAAVKSTIS